MNIKEYNKVKDYSYVNYCNYLKEKHGLVKGNYLTEGNTRTNEGLFIHHIGENEIAGLSSITIAKTSDSKYQEPEYLCYCDYLEHALLHIMIGEETAGSRNLGLHGNNLYILPALRSYYEEGIKQNVYNDSYYNLIKDDKEVYDLLLDRYNTTVEQADIVLDNNRTLYLQAERSLEENNKALIVLGTGLGKTTTALQYLWKHQCKGLVIGPNNLIKSGWESYGDWVDTTTYQSFANEYETIDYSKYGLVIIDEAHHAGYDVESDKGAAVWSKGIDHVISKNIKLLGLTATPIRSDGIDIGETIFKNCVCEGRAIEDAIEEGIIHPFSYITAIYDTTKLIEDISQYNDESEECKKLIGQLDVALNNRPSLKEILLKHMPKNKKRKGIIFIQEIADEPYAIEIFKDVYPNIEYRAIHSHMSNEKIIENREWFENTEEGYLLAVNMISEGAHYKGVNTLIMFRTTNSYLVYTQQLGRIITLVKDENPEAIVFDLVNNIENISYNDRKVNKKKDDKEHSVKKIIDALKNLKSDQIIVDDETRDIVKAIRKIKDYFDTSWEEWEDNILKEYYPEEGAEGCISKLNKRTIPCIIKRASDLNIKSNKFWTAEEDNLLKELYLKEGSKCFKQFNRTLSACWNRVNLLGLDKLNLWTEEEINILKLNYSKLGKSVFNLLPLHSERACITKAKRLHLNCKSTVRWTEEEINILKKYYPLEGKKSYKRLINRTILECQKIVKQYNLKYTNRKKVICLTTNEIFNSANEAAIKYCTTLKAIQGACNGDSKSCKGLYWQYYDDYLNNPKLINNLKKKTGESNRKKVLCLETNEMFDSIKVAQLKYGKIHISQSCLNKIPYAGKLPDGTKLHWRYIEDEEENKELEN